MKKHLKVYKKTVSIVDETSTGIYQNLVKDGVGFLMESYDKEYDQFTFIGRSPRAVLFSTPDGIRICYDDGSEEIRKGNPKQVLKDFYDEFEVEKDNHAIPFCGGLTGSLGYDFIRYTEDLPDDNPDEIGIPTVAMMLITEFIVVDHLAETMTGIVLEEPTEEGRKRAMKRAEVLLTEASEKIHETDPSFVQDGRIVNQTDTLEQYSEKVRKIKKYIRRGDVFQTVISQRWTIETGQTGFELYRELRRLNPSPYLFYYNFGDFEIIGSSPEMIVRQRGDRVYTCPIAGTRPRGKTPEEDARLTEELLGDKKEQAEHVMLVDLARNDMGRIAEFGTVKVADFMKVQYYSHVMHIVSLVEGQKKEQMHPFELIASFLPAGTLSGAPKIRAMEIIDELETVRRGLYGGATGYIDFSGDMDFCITIRTMVKKKNLVYLQAGAGIVADSVPENEYQECCNKVMALARTLVTEENL